MDGCVRKLSGCSGCELGGEDPGRDQQEVLETVVERPGGTDGARESEGWFESGLSNEGSFSACVATRRDLHVPLWSQCAHGGNTGLYAWAEAVRVVVGFLEEVILN